MKQRSADWAIGAFKAASVLASIGCVVACWGLFTMLTEANEIGAVVAYAILFIIMILLTPMVIVATLYALLW